MTNKPQNNQIAINEKAAIDIRVASSQVSRHDTDRRELYTEQEVVKILFLASEHSLFRNAQAVQVSMFVRLCQEHDVLVVTPQLVYDLANPAHVLLFRMAVEV